MNNDEIKSTNEISVPNSPSLQEVGANQQGIFEKMSKKQKILLITGLSVFLILTIVGSGFAYYLATSKNNTSTDSNETSSTTNPNSTDVPTPTDSTQPTRSETTPAPSQLGNYKVQFTGKPVKLEKLTVFKPVLPADDYTPGLNYPSFEVDTNTITDYYSVGKVVGGTYDGYEVVYGFSDNGLTEKYKYAQFALLKKGNDIVVFNYAKSTNFPEAYDFISKNWLADGIKTDSDTSFYDLLFGYADINDSKITFGHAYVSPIIDENLLSKSIKLSDGTQTYLSKDSKDTGIYVLTKSGFYKRYYYRPSLMKVQVYNEIPQITWTTAKAYTNTYNYSYVGFAVCGVSENIGVTNIPMTKLKQTGKTSTGQAVYEYINPAEDTFLNKLYTEDYKAMEINKGNTITEDDSTPFTFEQYRQYHPVFYWKDEFGRLIQFESNEFMMVGGCAKPAIYLYPEKTTQVNVELNLKGPLTLSIPSYKNGWNATVSPDGTITSNGEKYDYLFWEGRFENFRPNTSIGWSIKKSEVEIFLNKKLDELGFNQKEKAQFLEYWLPRLKSEKSEYIYINFLDEKYLDQVAPLNINPKPDSYKRYFMVYRGENSYRELTAPKLKKAERKGFFMFEWGGARLNQ